MQLDIDAKANGVKLGETLNNEEWSGIRDDWENNTNAEKIVKAAMEREGITEEEIPNVLSKYGASNYGECFAEAISEVESTDNPGSFAMAIVEEYEKYRNGLSDDSLTDAENDNISDASKEDNPDEVNIESLGGLEKQKEFNTNDLPEKTQYESEFPEVAEKVREITRHYYYEAGELARNNEDGRYFTDHKEDHVEMVAQKSLEVGDAIKKAVESKGLGQTIREGRISFSADIDKKVLEGAALSHDTGMAGNGYALVPLRGEDGGILKDQNGRKLYEKNPDGSYVIKKESNIDYSEIRDNHTLNSAINVLSNRDLYLEAGYTNTQIDKMAAECIAHSKSNSGILDLNSKEDWSDCFDRIEAAICAYNNDHPDAKIKFDRKPFENDDKLMGSLVSESLALRLGDVSRDSGPNAETQSGEIVYVDRSTIDNHAGSVEGELKNADISIGEDGENVENLKSRIIHAGEQNITNNHTFVPDNGNMTHEITVADGASAPFCTLDICASKADG